MHEDGTPKATQERIVGQLYIDGSVMITVATQDMRFYFRIVNELKRRRLSFKSILPSAPIPSETEVVLTTHTESPSIVFTRVVGVGKRQSCRYAVDKALRLMWRKERFHEVVLGIDWGRSIGIAAKGDGIILRTVVVIDLPSVGAELKYIFRAFPSDVCTIRIGRTSIRGSLSDLVRLIHRIKKGIRVEIVDERRTSRLAKSSKAKKLFPQDAMSALYIASRRGAASKKSDESLWTGT